MFNSTVIIYTKPDCPWCEKMKEWFDLNDIEYTVSEVGKDITKEELQSKAEPGVITTVPQVFIGGVRFGGYTETVAREDDILRFKNSTLKG